jgi:hypothetical protein
MREPPTLHGTCEIVRKTWWQGVLQEIREDQEMYRKAFADYAGSPRGQFEMAARQCAQGQPAALIDHLLSDRPLSSADRIILALLVKGKLGKSPPGAPKDRKTRYAASRAVQFYEQWRLENKRLGVRDYRLSDSMKDKAAEIVIADLALRVDFETVRDLMDRPDNRRR